MSWLGSWSILQCSCRDRPASTGTRTARVQNYGHLKKLLPYFSRWVSVCSFPSAQQACRSFFRVIYVEGPLKGPQSATPGWLRTTTFSSGFLLFICGSSLSDYKLDYYNTLSSVSTAHCVITRNLNYLFI